MKRETADCEVIAAEDDDELFALTESALSEPNFSIRRVRDGEELMQLLQDRGPYNRRRRAAPYAVILLDLNMPRKDGRQALLEIKTDPSLRCIPVIILSTSRSSEDVRVCYERGANAYIARPAAYEELVEVLNAFKQHWFHGVELPEFPVARR